MEKMESLENQFPVASIRLKHDRTLMSETPIRTPMDAVRLLAERMCDLDREVVCVVNIRTDGKPINCSLVSMGAVDQSLAHPREIMKTAILSNATSMILMHNHPSGSLNPSNEDTMLTDRMMQVGDLMGIVLLDHIIVGGDPANYFSFKEQAMMEFEKPELKTDYRDIQWERQRAAENSAVGENQGAGEIEEPVVRPRVRRHR